MDETPSTENIVERAYDALRTVWDPELAIDIVTLGLIYDVRAVDGGVEVDMTMTTPGCPVSDSLPAEATIALQNEFPQMSVWVNVVWDPPWDPSRIGSDGSNITGVLGGI
ncbi:MAG: metal-sulfur cluster assembly factor [Acidimicrobiia bacterium]|nr:metal-sulfur cluster assembly factor [Acidimicrobiia bacterium]